MSFSVKRESPPEYAEDVVLGRFDSQLEAIRYAEEKARTTEYVVYDENGLEVFWTNGDREQA